MEKRKHPHSTLFVPIHENVYIIDAGAGVNSVSHPLAIHWELHASSERFARD